MPQRAQSKARCRHMRPGLFLGEIFYARRTGMTDRCGPNSQFRITLQPAALVIGIAGRTSNAREMAGTGIIGEQWERFMRENLAAQIPERVDSAMVAVYTDYASDKDGVGARVKS